MRFDQQLENSLEHRLARRVRRALWMTGAGLWFERLGLAFWPFISLVAMSAGLVMLGALDGLPRWGLWTALGIFALVGCATVLRGLYQLERPGTAEALLRVDAELPGRPLQALSDTPLIGAGDADAERLWQAHRRRMATRLTAVRPVPPQLRLARRDPYALRLLALTTLGAGLLFGSLDRAGTLAELGQNGRQIASGPIWEGWIRPPAYSGKPTLYLGDLDPDFSVPKGSEVSLRFYAEDGALQLRETVSGNAETLRDFAIRHSGEIEIDGPTGRLWDVALQPDQPPVAELVGAMTRAPSGEARQGFLLTDDFGVTRATLTITRDVTAVERRFGFQIAAEDRPAIELPVILPQTGDRSEIEGQVAENLSQHAFAGLPVNLSLTAWDAAGQASATALGKATLPSRRFFDPLAAALIDQRRELLWNRDNAPRTAQVLRAVSVDPNQVFDHMDGYFRLKDVIKWIEGREGQLSDAQVDAISADLWDIALELEDGQLKEALARLHRAQERLSQAMRDGASAEEIDKLMQELREATQDYIQQLAEQQGETGDGTDMPDQGPQNGQQMNMAQLQQLMDRIQELMEQGRMAEAQQLMDMLAELLENMRVTPGQSQGQGEQGMQGLQEALRNQQQLNDDTFEQLQDGFNQGRQGEDGSSGQPQDPAQEGGQEPPLSERQQALRDALRQQRRNLPGAGGGADDSLGGALERADRAMREAEQALRNDELSDALDRQAEAMEALREGMRQLGENQARNQQDQEGQQGEAGGKNSETQGRDPLGRSTGDSGRYGSDEGLYEGEDVYRRAEELLDEIRRRSEDQGRMAEERDYLNRLLDQF